MESRLLDKGQWHGDLGSLYSYFIALGLKSWLSILNLKVTDAADKYLCKFFTVRFLSKNDETEQINYLMQTIVEAFFGFSSFMNEISQNSKITCLNLHRHHLRLKFRQLGVSEANSISQSNDFQLFINRPPVVTRELFIKHEVFDLVGSADDKLRFNS